MSDGSLSPRVSVVLGTLALAPVVWYGITSSNTAGAVAAVNVALIIGTLLVATGPTAGPGAHGGPSA
ncbi:cytochrome-ba3 oxidase subunit [Natronomonas sp. LN261]|jgi:hypothetical protein|uniref:cytochrome-ba3 oxidase subunit n=1 Tax=Natronomonas sp. LN261 TaxID=2750669 RepID=UPI0015EEFDB1|nr:cytochrome-ba3 oxidase subunit [Natronomonas sp. LN261]